MPGLVSFANTAMCAYFGDGRPRGPIPVPRTGCPSTSQLYLSPGQDALAPTIDGHDRHRSIVGAGAVWSWVGTLVVNTSHLRTSHGKCPLERIKQVDKIEKLILRIKRCRWRQLALLGFVLVVDLLDLTTV